MKDVVVGGVQHASRREIAGDGVKSCLPLAVVESRPLLRSPAVVGSLVLSLPLLALGPDAYRGDDTFVRYKLLAGAGCVILAIGVGISSSLAAARDRRSDGRAP